MGGTHVRVQGFLEARQEDRSPAVQAMHATCRAPRTDVWETQPTKEEFFNHLLKEQPGQDPGSLSIQQALCLINCHSQDPTVPRAHPSWHSTDGNVP
jgi:hypothetical protein